MTPLNIVQNLLKVTDNYGIQFELPELEALESWIRKSYLRLCHTALALCHMEQSQYSNKADKIQGALRQINILQDFAWEKLNIGHWIDVLLVWRKLYTYLTLLKVTVLAGDGRASVPELLKICDNGLLMGCPVLDNILAKIAHHLHILHSPDSETAAPNYSLKPLNSELESFINRKSMPSLPGPQFVVPSEELPSLELFSTKYFQPEKPVLLKGTIRHWPAMEKWSPEYIVKTVGARTVPVEIGSKYTAEDWTQKLITIEEFAQLYMNRDKEEGPVGYIAQHQLFDQMPELQEDIRVPEYCCLGKNVVVNAWFGPAGTLTPTHYDPNHNCLAQVFGYKLVRLFPPSETTNLYPHPHDSLLFNTSQVDLENDQACHKFPNLRNATFTDVILSPGSVLFIPRSWWHMVKSLSPSFSVSFWFEAE